MTIGASFTGVTGKLRWYLQNNEGKYCILHFLGVIPGTPVEKDHEMQQKGQNVMNNCNVSCFVFAVAMLLNNFLLFTPVDCGRQNGEEKG
jgi:hypothetical protein